MIIGYSEKINVQYPITNNQFPAYTLLLTGFIKQIVLDGLDPLGRVGDFEGGAVPFIILVDKVDLHYGLVQVVAFYAIVRVNLGDIFSDNGKFQLDGSAAVKKLVRQEQQKPAAFSGLARFAGPAEIVYAKTHGQDLLIAEALLDPFAVPPANKGNIADDAEEDEGDIYPLLVGVKVLHSDL